MKNKNNEIDISVNNLITIYYKLEEYLNYLDTKNTEHRQLVIQAIEEYIKKYVTPALYLMPNIYLNDLFDIDSVGMFFEAQFNFQRENLDRPSDEELTSILEVISDLEPTSELKNKFWNSWLVEESSLCIVSLCSFLEEPFISTRNKQIKPDVLSREIKQIEYILTLEMPPDFKEDIENILRWEQEALAVWNEEETSS